jgi:energy-coupling factor transporter transmembrane protein EcfT
VNHPHHPASRLLLGLSVLLAASSRNGMELLLDFLLLAVVALVAARSHFWLLLRRSRWLLLAMLLMFGWLTPGTPLPGLPGASREGLLLAAENLERFLLALAVVALILKVLPPVQLVAGIRSLLAPLALLSISRDQIAVRLALTMQEVESSRNGDPKAREPEVRVLSLPTPSAGATDYVLGLLSAGLLLAAWLT